MNYNDMLLRQSMNNDDNSYFQQYNSFLLDSWKCKCKYFIVNNF